MYVDLIQSIKGLEEKDGGILRKREFCMQTVFGLAL